MDEFLVTFGLGIAGLLIVLLCVLVGIRIADRKGRPRIEAFLLVVFLGLLGPVVEWLLPTRPGKVKTQRRPFQFSLRTLLLLVLLASVLMSWFAVVWKRTKSQNAVLAHFEKYDHNVHWRYGFYEMYGPMEDCGFGYVYDVRFGATTALLPTTTTWPTWWGFPNSKR